MQQRHSHVKKLLARRLKRSQSTPHTDKAHTTHGNTPLVVNTCCCPAVLLWPSPTTHLGVQQGGPWEGVRALRAWQG
jgi:hypothetical protein